ncbi:MAG: hypothetical protein JXB00_08480 [Bacteroidales bacterium]|nr:hypothetical protein [Bacteroidales bacterium]
MKPISFFIILFCSLQIWGQNQIDFERYFHNRTMRLDFYHSGHATEETIIPDQIYVQGEWAGNPSNTIQCYNMGKYSAKVYDALTNNLVFSTGYSTTFGEYQTTNPALDKMSRTYHESVLIPYPKNKFVFVIEKRDRYNIPCPIYKTIIDPADYHIITENVKRDGDEIIFSVQNSIPHKSVDLLIIGEGYTKEEEKLFKKDLEYFTGAFFSIEPYASHRNKFNIAGIFTPSAESGTDEPRQGIYRNTVLNSSFNIFDLDRYLLADNNKAIRDIAAQVPYDAILIMVNSERYGGGGIFNWQTVFTARSSLRDYVFLHEFGHGFAGLGDEYYTSDVAYSDFYPAGIEPTDPNVTALLDPAQLKWKDLVSPGINIPTEWGKAAFDSLNMQVALLTRKKADSIQVLTNTGAKPEVIKSTRDYFDNLIIAGKKDVDAFLFNHPLKDKVGAFEGAGYQSEGLYRPTINSMMHRFDPGQPSYGKVNERAIVQMIEFFTK